MPWIFMMLMLANGIYLGWNFLEGAGPQPAAQRPMAQEGPELALLSERPDLLRRSEEPEVAEVEQVAPVSTGGTAFRQCFFVGAFPNDADLREFIGALRAKGFEAKVSYRKVDLREYWVFIPPFTNRAKAEERLRDLRARGIQGFVVKDGVFVNAISLNRFSRRDLADAFLLQMQKEGIIVEYREMVRAGRESWVYAGYGRGGGGDLKSAIDSYLSRSPEVSKQITACEE